MFFSKYNSQSPCCPLWVLDCLVKSEDIPTQTRETLWSQIYAWPQYPWDPWNKNQDLSMQKSVQKTSLTNYLPAITVKQRTGPQQEDAVLPVLTAALWCTPLSTINQVLLWHLQHAVKPFSMLLLRHSCPNSRSSSQPRDLSRKPRSNADSTVCNILKALQYFLKS